ncbi:DUF433 domain-containing protein [uncultured Hydrogenophaga sp.]|uniref:DUF433 domain-containing protein n=1 Tax=uncultured Hydrogenophaga sp. TaxID=199683 RepID=UPI00258A3D52|nr:DUF433 domain-containing protein [uncultured Hydrogenophaga sp.]
MEHTAPLLGTGLYPLPRAAKLLGTEPRTVRRWLKGYSWKYRDGRRTSGPLWPLQYASDEELGTEQVLSFRDLLELRTVSRFVAQGVSLKVIRATIDVAREVLGEYPLHSRRFVTDGKKIFLDAVNLAGGSELLDLKAKQYAIDVVIRSSLLEGIEYDDNANALRWYPNPRRKAVVLDPQIQFGEPIVAESGIPTDTLAAAYEAEGKNAGRVARLYRVTTQAVRAAVDFEQRLAA